MLGVEHRIYPEMAAGGFSRVDHRMTYIVRVNALLRPDMTVLELGAGHGKWRFDPSPFRRWLGDLRGRCHRVIGVDVDPAVLANPQVDEAHLIGPDGRLPLPDGSVDLVSAFSVFEHVEDAERTASELARVLRPGGWICAWTPNRWGYVGVAARLVPKPLHRWVLRLVEPRREEEDSFPPVYRMNTAATLRRLFPSALFEDHSYAFDGQPFYHMERRPLAQMLRGLFWMTPPGLKGFRMVFLRRRGDPPDGPEPWPLPPLRALDRPAA